MGLPGDRIRNAPAVQSTHRAFLEQAYRLLNFISDFASSPRGKWITLAVWLVLGGLIISLSPTLSDITTNDTLQFLPQEAESTQAAELVRERFATDATPAIIVFRNEAGLSEADLAAAEEASNAFVAMMDEENSDVASVVSIFTVPQARAELVSADETTMTMIVNITGSPAEDAYDERIEALRDITDQLDGDQLQVKVSGPGGLVADLVSVFSNIDGFLLIVTVTLVLLLLVIIYRSPVVALVPIMLVGLVFQMAGGVGALILDAADFAVSGQTTGIMTVILFGAGTDYFLFISARYREELTRNADKHAAMRATMRGVAGAINSAAGTLILASSILLLAELGSYKSLGPVIAIAIALMLLASLTLVPATLAILGRFAFWPFQPRHEPQAGGNDAQRSSRIWERIADFVLGRSGRVLTTTTLVLLLLAAGTFLLEPSYDSLESLPSDVDSVAGFQLLREGFPPGQLAPTDVYVEFPAGSEALSPENLGTLAAISEAIAGLDGVDAVTSPAYPRGVGADIGPEQVLAALEAVPPELQEQIAAGEGGPPEDVDPNSELARAVGLFVSALDDLSIDRAVARIEVTLSDNPYSNAAMDTIPEIRDAARDSAAEHGLERSSVLVGGETAENQDTRAANNRDTLVVLPIILLAIMIVLGILLRSVVAALYIGGTIILTYFATLGLSVLFFRYVLGHDSVGSSVPFFLFVFLNALGVDYSIYLMSRVREEARGNADLTAATREALARTGGVITSAGLILAGTFGALMTLPLRDLFQLGFGVSIGVLMDTFVTRSLLVPSLVNLLGRWNWWPSKPAAPQPAPGDD